MAEPSPGLMTLLENFNTDIAMAQRDAIGLDELTALAGSITQSVLQAIPTHMRRECWNVMVNIMERKFRQGEL